MVRNTTHWLWFPPVHNTPLSGFSVYFNIYSFILSQRLIALQLDLLHKKDARCICNSVEGLFEPLKLYAFDTHLTTLNQILLHRRLSPYSHKTSIQSDYKG